MKQCPRCKNEALTLETIRYSQEYQGKFYIVENVPAWVCGQCGEIIITETTAEKIQGLIWSGNEPTRTEQVPVYEMAS